VKKERKQLYYEGRSMERQKGKTGKRRKQRGRTAM